MLSSISHSNESVPFTTIKLCYWESSYAFATQSMVLGPEHYYHPKACYKCRILSPVPDLLIRTCISIRSPNDSYAHESLGSTGLYTPCPYSPEESKRKSLSYYFFPHPLYLIGSTWVMSLLEFIKTAQSNHVSSTQSGIKFSLEEHATWERVDTLRKAGFC